jgi:aliphatic nitrilase
MTSIRVAAVQAAPVFLDLSASVDKAIALITEAASSGAALIGFPEGYLPGHPGWVEFLPFEEQSLLLGKRLFQESLEIPSSNIDRLAEAARANSISIVMGCCERIAGSTGSLYNTQFFISADGEYRGKHQKIVPTVGERLFHAPGNTGSSCAFPTPFGQVSALICGENSNPLSQYAAIREYPVVHVAAWPQHFSAAVPMQPVIRLVSAALAYSMKSFVINAVSTVSAEMVSAYGSLPGGEFLNSPLARGRASVISPTGQVLAEAPDDSEQLVYADIDTDTVIIPKIVHDYAGHYNRPELFTHLF